MSAIAELKAMLSMDSSRYKAGMKEASSATTQFQGQLSNIAGAIGVSFSTAAIVTYAKSVIDWSSKLSEAAQNVGILTAEMTAFNDVALVNGLDVDKMQMMLGKMNVKINDAVTKGGDSEKTFTDMGISLEELVKLPVADRFQMIAKAATESGNSVANLAGIFGERLGPKAVAAMQDLAKNGLGEVDKDAGKAADKLESVGDTFAIIAEAGKKKSSGWLASLVTGVERAGEKVFAISKSWGGDKTFGGTSRERLINAEKFAVANRTAEEDAAKAGRTALETQMIAADKAELAARRAKEAAAEKAEIEKEAAKNADKAAQEQYRKDMARLDELIKASIEADRKQKEIDKQQKPFDEKLSGAASDVERARSGEGASYRSSYVDELARRGGMSKSGGVGQFEIASKQLSVQQRILEAIEKANSIQEEYSRFIQERE